MFSLSAVGQKVNRTTATHSHKNILLPHGKHNRLIIGWLRRWLFLRIIGPILILNKTNCWTNNWTNYHILYLILLTQCWRIDSTPSSTASQIQYPPMVTTSNHRLIFQIHSWTSKYLAHHLDLPINRTRRESLPWDIQWLRCSWT